MTLAIAKDTLYALDFRCDLDHGEYETGRIYGRWTGEIDTWGKYTVQPLNPAEAPHYLFAREITHLRALSAKAHAQLVSATAANEADTANQQLEAIRARLLTVKMGIPSEPLNQALATVINRISDAMIAAQAIR